MVAMTKPDMPILREHPDEIYQRMVNRLSALAAARGETPPATEMGDLFYDLLYPLAEEIAEQQQLLEYAFLQGFLPWADGEFLDAHGYRDGVDRKEGEDDESYRQRILEKARSEEGNGRPQDYERWAKNIEGVGLALAIERERNDVSIDLYLTDLQGQPVTTEFAKKVEQILWTTKRIAGHDLQCHPAEVFPIEVQVKLVLADETKRPEAISLITTRIQDYIKGRNTIVYQRIGALFLVDGVIDYTDYLLNGGTANLTTPDKAVSALTLVVLP